MKKFLSTLFSVLLVLSMLAPAAFADGETSESGESTAAAESGTLHFEFETLAESAELTNIVRGINENQGQLCTRKDEGTPYASGDAFWGQTVGKVTDDPTQVSYSFTFAAEAAGYYKVQYAVSDLNTSGAAYVSPLQIKVNDVVVGNNSTSHTGLTDLSKYGTVVRNKGTENEKTIENGIVYPWSYLGMGLFQGSALCYLNEGNNTLVVDVTKTTNNSNNFIFFADYIDFTPVSKDGLADVKQVDNGAYMARLVPDVGLGLPIHSSDTLSFDFTVPSDGNYVFMAKRDPNYPNSTVTLTVKEKANEEAEEKQSSIAWANASWANYNKYYARMGRESIALKAGTEYTLTASSTADVTVDYIDVIRTDVDVNGKVIIPGHYWSATDQTNDHYLHTRDMSDAAKKYIAANLTDYTVIGSLQAEVLTDKLNEAPVSVMIGHTGYVEYELNIPDDGIYSFSSYVRVYGGDGACAETIYLSVDGEEKCSAQYNPASTTDKDRALTFKTSLTKGTHKIRLSRKALTGDYAKYNDLMYIPFITAESKSSAIMYKGTVTTSENIITSLEEGTVSVRIKNSNYELIARDEEVMAFFAIYDSTNQMVGVDSYIGTPSGDTIDLTIENFNMEAGKTYTAKAFLWNNKLQGTCFELGSTSSN